MYLRVALLAPLTICFQSDQVKVKRQRYSSILLAVDLAFYTSIATSLTVEIALSVQRWVLALFWAIYGTVLTWALCFALKRIRSYMNAMNLNGLIPSRALIFSH